MGKNELKLGKVYSGNTRVIGILGLLIIGMILAPVASMNTQSTNEVVSAAQACEVSGLDENTVISSTDARVRESWKPTGERTCLNLTKYNERIRAKCRI